MALTKTQKQEVVADLTEGLKDAKTIVFVNFKGLTVAESDSLRSTLRQSGVSFRVAKKTLLARVLGEKSIAGEMPALEGEIAIAWSSDDILAPAREVFNFGKGKQTPTIAGGVFEGAYLDQAAMLAIATIPSRETLIAQFVNLINSPIQRFVIALNQIAEQKA